MIDAKQLREYIVRPALQEMNAWSESAENLVLGTAAQESALGKYIVQIGGGPALGIFQMEPLTHDDIWNNFLSYKKDLPALIREGGYRHAHRLIFDLKYAAKMCRAHYLRKPGAIPDTVEGMAKYWKLHYNTPLGKGTEQEFVENYHRYLG